MHRYWSRSRNLLQNWPDTPQKPKRPFAVCRTFEEYVLVGSTVVAETTVVVSVKCTIELTWDSCDAVLAREVGPIVDIDALDVRREAEASKRLELLCKDVVSGGVTADVAIFETDGLARASVACDSAVSSPKSEPEAVTVMVTIGTVT